MKKLAYIAVGIVTLMISCQSDDINDSLEVGNQCLTYLNDGNLQRISAKALDFVTCLQQESRSGGTDISVASVYAWKACDIFPQTRIGDGLSSDTLLYIVNFNNDNGFALVSGNEKYDGVVAYVESGSLRPTDVVDNPGFRLFVDGVAFQLSDPFFSGYTHGDSVQFGPFPRPDVWRTTAFYPPLLTTNWGQRDPFNRLCYTSEGESALAGCVAISIGQIFAYYQEPASYNGHTYNWSQILTGARPQTEEGKTSVSELIHDIGQIVNMNYGVDESSANIDSINSCLNLFNFNFTYSYDFDFETFETDLQDLHPCIMNGAGYSSLFGAGGHSWVIDGAIVQERDQFLLDPPYTTVQKREFIHCNWGWNGTYNGYFIPSAFSTVYDQNGENPTWVPPYYNVTTRVFYNIYPLNQ